ncbi:hypothetical protein GDO81_026321, partial [Engystomops pustulosus]
GDAPECYKCHERNSQTCQQELETCQEGEHCVTILEDFIYDGNCYASILKDCIRDIPCNTTIYGREDH